METRLLTLAFNGALRLLPEVSGDRELPSDAEALAGKILLLLLEPNERHAHGEAISGYDEEKHRVFIAYYCAVGQLPHPALAVVAFAHELAHILLEMDEEEAEQVTIRAAEELGLDPADSGVERRKAYQDERRVWDEGRFPYLAVLRDEITAEDAKGKIREMADRGFDLSL